MSIWEAVAPLVPIMGLVAYALGSYALMLYIDAHLDERNR